MSFKNDVLAALKMRQDENAQSEREALDALTETTKEHLKGWFERYHVESVVGNVFIVEGVKMRLERDYGKNLFTVFGACPRCGAECASREVPEFADIGELLVEFKPTYEHFCGSAAPIEDDKSNTPEARLLSALRDFIADDYSTAASA